MNKNFNFSTECLDLQSANTPRKQVNNEDETDIEDLEVICTLEEEDEEELLCLSKSGIEKIHCYDYEKRQRERFEMLDDHTNEIIKKSNLTSPQSGRLPIHTVRKSHIMSKNSIFRKIEKTVNLNFETKYL